MLLGRGLNKSCKPRKEAPQNPPKKISNQIPQLFHTILITQQLQRKKAVKCSC
jgi:hypothetical protein